MLPSPAAASSAPDPSTRVLAPSFTKTRATASEDTRSTSKDGKADEESATRKAGLISSVTKVKTRLKNHPGKHEGRVSVAASVYLAAVLQYVIAEVLQLSGDVTREENSNNILNEHIDRALAGDEELSSLLRPEDELSTLFGQVNLDSTQPEGDDGGDEEMREDIAEDVEVVDGGSVPMQVQAEVH